MSAICIIYRMLCQTLSPTSFRLKKRTDKNKQKRAGKKKDAIKRLKTFSLKSVTVMHFQDVSTHGAYLVMSKIYNHVSFNV